MFVPEQTNFNSLSIPEPTMDSKLSVPEQTINKKLSGLEQAIYILKVVCFGTSHKPKRISSGRGNVYPGTKKKKKKTWIFDPSGLS